MAEITNFEDFKESFEYITDALDSMRAQNALNAGSFDKILTNINNQLEVISNEENTDLIKVFLAELKRSLDERHTFVSSKFSEIEESFSDLVKRAESQLKAHEIRELFEIIAKNLSNFSTDFSAQKDLINAVGLKIEEFHQDDSQKTEILKNIAILKTDIEKLSPGFESIIVNVNDHFKEVGEKLSELDPTESLGGIKKDIENIFVSSNAVLSALQVIDRKNRELEEVITHLVTKEDFNLERDQVAKLILQNIELTNYINMLPKQEQLTTLTEKVDTTVGVINALKNMITESGKQNQELLTVQLDNLEKKILNISTEEEFIGFRKELAEFAKQVMDSTNMMRADLDTTNSELKGLLAFLNSVDIKNSFISFAKTTKATEENIQKSLVDLSSIISNKIEEKQELTKENIDESVSKVDASITSATEEIKEHSKLNLASITEHIQSVINSIFQVKNAIQVENMEQAEAIDTKLQDLKEDFTNSSNFIVNNSQENLEKVLSNIEKVFQEILVSREEADENSSSASKDVRQKFEDITVKIEEIKENLGANSRESFENILALVNDFSRKISEMEEFLKQNTEDNSVEIRGQALALIEKFSSIQETLTKSSEINFSQTQEILEELIQTTKSAKAALEQTSMVGFGEVKSNIEVIAERLENIQDDFDIKSQNNLSKIVNLFEDLTKTVQSNETNLSEELKSNIEEIKSVISSIPETIRANQGVFEDEKRLLIEENSKNISEMGEKVQDLIKSLVARENPFKGEVLFELAELKSSMEKFKEGLNETNSQLGEKVEDEINQVIKSVEESIAQYDEKHDLALLSLQNKLSDYFEALQESANETDIKLNNSIKEISEIKPELISIIDGINVLSNDSSLSELSNQMSNKLDGILLNITQLEESFSNKNKNSLESVLTNLQERFESVSEDLKTYKNLTASELEGFIEDLVERFEIVKSQINLTNTDILNLLTEKTGEISNWLSSIKDSVNEIIELNLEELISDVKKKIDNSHYELSSNLKNSIKEENLEQTENLQAKLDELSDKFETQIIEKIIENQNVAKDSLLNDLEEKLISMKESFQLSTQSAISKSVENANDRLCNKINLLQESVNEVQEESKETLNKLLDIQNESKNSIAEILEENISSMKESLAALNVGEEITENLSSKIDSVRASVSLVSKEIENQLLNAESNAHATTKAIITQITDVSEEKIFDKLNNVEEKVLESQKETKEILLSQLNDNIESIKNDLYSLSLDSDFVEEFSQKMETLQNTVSAAVKDIDYSNASVTEKFDSLEDKLLDAQENTKALIVDKIIENQDAVKSDLIAEIENSMASVKDNYHTSTQSLVSKIVDASNDNLYEKLENLKESLVEGQDETRTAVINQLKEYLESSELDEALINEVSKKIDSIQNKIVLEHEETKQAILDELQENINLIKESLSSSNLEENLTREFSKSIEDSNETLSNKIETLQEKLLEGQDEVKMTIFNELKENIITIKEDLESLNIDEKVFEEISQNIEVIEAKLLESVDESKEEILKEIAKAKTSTESMLVEELSENINVIKEVLESISSDDSVYGELSQKIGTIEETLSKVSEEITGKISDTEESYKTSTQGLLSEIKTTFWEKVDDSIDELRSFLELVESKKDFAGDLDKLKTEIFDNFSEVSEGLEESIKSISVKDDLDDLHKDINSSLDNLFGNLEEKVKSVFEDSKILSEISSQNDEANRRIEDLKKAVIEDINAKLDGFELNIDGQKKDFSTLIEELKGSVAELKENFIDLNLNSSMEISGIFTTVQEKIESIESTLSAQNYDKKFDEISNKIENIDLSNIIDSVEDKIKNLDLSEIVKSVEAKIDDINIEKPIKESKEELAKEFEVINQKLDLFASESSSEVEESIKEIKQIVQAQSKTIEQLNKLTENDNSTEIQKEIQKSFKDFEAKLDTLSKTDNGNDTEEIKKELKTLKQEISENVIELFNQISFVVEAEEIKDFVEEKTEEIKEEIIDKIKHIRMQGGSSESNIDSYEIRDFIEEKTEEIKAEFSSKLKDINTSSSDLDFETEEIKYFIEERTGEIKDYLKKLQHGLEAEEDYSYTLQDVESDIAKVRMILNDIIKAKEEQAPQDDFEKLNENLMSISTRTNKLLLNSDESYSVLKENLSDFRNIVYQLEERIKKSDTRDAFAKVDKKMDNLNNLVLSCVKADKLFNQSFMYLAQWIDTASENLETIQENAVKTEVKMANAQDIINDLRKTMPKRVDVDNVLDELSERFDKQQEKIDNLELKIEKLLDLVENGASKVDSKANKKIDSIDKQLTKLSKSIEMLTSYVDEG